MDEIKFATKRLKALLELPQIPAYPSLTSTLLTSTILLDLLSKGPVYQEIIQATAVHLMFFGILCEACVCVLGEGEKLTSNTIRVLKDAWDGVMIKLVATQDLTPFSGRLGDLMRGAEQNVLECNDMLRECEADDESTRESRPPNFELKLKVQQRYAEAAMNSLRILHSSAPDHPNWRISASNMSVGERSVCGLGQFSDTNIPKFLRHVCRAHAVDSETPTNDSLGNKVTRIAVPSPQPGGWESERDRPSKEQRGQELEEKIGEERGQRGDTVDSRCATMRGEAHGSDLRDEDTWVNIQPDMS